MRRSSAREAQTEPIAALVAVVVVALALSLYAGAFEGTVPEPADRNRAEQAADRVERALTEGGVVNASRLPETLGRAPKGHEMNVTLSVDNDTERVGPPSPGTADVASRRVSVGVGEGRVSPGRLEVRVWI